MTDAPARRSTFDLHLEAEALLAQGAMAADDEIEPWFEACAEWVDAAEDKLLAVRVLRQTFLAKAAAAKAEAARFTAYQRRHTGGAARMDELAHVLLEARDQVIGEAGSKADLSDGSWAKLRSHPKLDSSGVDLEELARTHPSLIKPGDPSLRGKEAKALLQDGVEIPGLVINPNWRVSWSK